MGNPVVTNIIVGGATLWYAPVGEAFPAASVYYGVAWGGNWARVGYTAAPVRFRYEDEHFTAQVEEHLTGVKRIRVAESATVETVFAELTPAYVALILGGSASSVAAGAGQRAYDRIKAGGRAAVPAYAWGFEGQYTDASGDQFPIRFFVPKATGMINGEMSFSWRESAYSGIPIKLDALADVGAAAGDQLFWIERITEKATDE